MNDVYQLKPADFIYQFIFSTFLPGMHLIVSILPTNKTAIKNRDAVYVDPPQ